MDFGRCRRQVGRRDLGAILGSEDRRAFKIGIDNVLGLFYICTSTQAFRSVAVDRHEHVFEAV